MMMDNSTQNHSKGRLVDEEFVKIVYAQRNHVVNASIDSKYLTVHLRDGRIIQVPITSYIWLSNATPEARGTFEVSGVDLEWKSLGRTIALSELLLGKPE